MKTFRVLRDEYIEHASDRASWVGLELYLKGFKIHFVSDNTSGTVDEIEFDQAVKFPVGAAESAKASLTMVKAPGTDNTARARARKYSGDKITMSGVLWYK